MSEPINILKQNLKEYKKKYYKNLIIKGLILFFSLIISAFLLVAFLENIGHFDSNIRTVLFFIYLGIVGFSLTKWIIIPSSKLLNLDKELSDVDAARQIGRYFPEISDKLLNTLQLYSISAQENSLIAASIAQKTENLSKFTFSSAVNYKTNNTLASKYLLIPSILFLLLLIIIPEFITESASRIVRYNEEIVPQAPFSFIIENDLKAFKNEDLTLSVKIEGDIIPDQVYFEENGLRKKLTKLSADSYELTLSRLNKNTTFQLFANGFYSQQYEITILARPEIKAFKVDLDYPRYLQKSHEVIQNVGSITVPEGTNITWTVNTEDVESLKVKFESDSITTKATEKTSSVFSFTRKVKNTESFSLKGYNKNGANKDKIEYRINVIKDQHPNVVMKEFKDTILYSTLFLTGNIQDDYGITDLRLFYKTSDSESNKAYQSKRIPFNANQTNQSFVYNLNLDSLHLKPGEQLEYYVTVWDNDGVNGRKSASSRVAVFGVPSEKNMKEELDKSAKDTEKAFEKALKETKEFREELKKTNEKIQAKKNLDWQDKKDVEKLIQKQKQLENQVDNLKENFEKQQQQSERFEKQDERLKEKLKQLDELMKDLLDEETKKLMEELEKLLQENSNPEKLKEKLDQLQKKEENLENEIDRTLELFKQMQFEQKLEQAKDKLEELAQKQEELAKDTEQKKESTEELAKEQEEINKEFEEVKEDLKELEEVNESLKNKNDTGDLSEQQKDVEQDLKDSKESLDSGKNKKASDSQKDAAKKMQEMAQKMGDMQQSMGAEQAQENMDDLRDILENLVKLSFEQEALMLEFRKVRQTDPRFVELSQKQLKLNDDAKIIEDSLLSLASRVVEIQSFVTREVSAMKNYMEESTEIIKQRNAGQAAGKQQYAMTSMNNLALMLNDVLKQMQEQMAKQMQGDQMCNKPGKGKPGKSGTPKLGDMQKGLNDMIKELQGGQKSGRQLSEQLAKMAAQQEAIRRAMKEMEGQGKGTKPGDKTGEEGEAAAKELSDKLKKLEQLMEKTEEELVNKQLSQKTIQRQQDILTRLLEAEKAMKEKDFENKRESKTATQFNRTTTPEIEKYLKEKQKEIELLKTIPPNLTPYYKQEINEYFQSIEK